MSERQRFIRPATVARPELVAQCLRRVATMLDLADDGKKTTFFAHLDDAAGPREGLAAWSQALLVLADEHNIDTAVINGIANRISKGVQGEFKA